MSSVSIVFFLFVYSLSYFNCNCNADRGYIKIRTITHDSSQDTGQQALPLEISNCSYKPTFLTLLPPLTLESSPFPVGLFLCS